jgi:hypothetical protein
MGDPQSRSVQFGEQKNLLPLLGIQIKPRFLGRVAHSPAKACCSTFYALQATSARFGLHSGTMKLNTQSEE